MQPAADIKTSWYYILLTLAAEPRHGLEIARETAALSNGRVRLWPTALYGTIELLADRGWIKELDDDLRPADTSDRKRIYAITAAGRVVLRQETRRLEDLLRIARRLDKAAKRSRT